MQNKTIVDGLKPYALGEKLRTLRLRKSHGPSRTGPAYGAVRSHVIETGTGKIISDLAHSTEDRNGIRRRPRSFFCRRT